MSPSLSRICTKLGMLDLNKVKYTHIINNWVVIARNFSLFYKQTHTIYAIDGEIYYMDEPATQGFSSGERPYRMVEFRNHEIITDNLRNRGMLVHDKENYTPIIT